MFSTVLYIGLRYAIFTDSPARLRGVFASCSPFRVKYTQDRTASASGQNSAIIKQRLGVIQGDAAGRANAAKVPKALRVVVSARSNGVVSHGGAVIHGPAAHGKRDAGTTLDLHRCMRVFCGCCSTCGPLTAGCARLVLLASAFVGHAVL